MPGKRPEVLGADLKSSESSPPPLPFAPPHSATASCSKGRLIRCTAPGLTPNCLAMTRTPGLPGVARASRIRFSSAGAIGGRRKAFTLTPGPREASTDPFLNHRPLELGKHAHHLKHRLPGGGGGVEPLLAQE